MRGFLVRWNSLQASSVELNVNHLQGGLLLGTSRVILTPVNGLIHDQWDFQGPPIMGPPYGKRDPYYSLIPLPFSNA